MSFTIGSLFDGSGGFPLAATMCGGIPKWASEVEPYPIAVTKSRFPNVKHLGSVTDINGGKVEPVDVITFGSPCQDLSVAGKRAGLKHEANGDDETTRSGLFMEAVRIIKEMREATNGAYPRFALWENVPGAFSSNKGEDFRIVLEELIKIVEPTAVMPAVPKNGWPYADSYCGDGWSIAYRVLDAQFWGVPQRRRRIYLVADFRGECAGKVSFEREGLRGHFETGRTPWQTAAGDAEAGSGKHDKLTCFEPGAASRLGGYCYNDVCGTLRATMGDNQFAVAYTIDRESYNCGYNFDRDPGINDDGISPTVIARGPAAVCITEPVPIHDQATRFSGKRGDNRDGKGNGLGVGNPGDKMNTLTGGDRHAVGFLTYQKVSGPLMANSHPGSYTGQDAFSDMLVAGKEETPVVIDRAFFNQGQNAKFDPAVYTDGTVPTLVARGPAAVAVRYIVRRLTPTECARLQGFPDEWGHIDVKDELSDKEYQFWLNVRNTHATINGKATKEYTKGQILKWYNGLHTDSSEYKMWGNGIALPNALYMMQGIADVMSEEKAARRKWLHDLLGDCL